MMSKTTLGMSFVFSGLPQKDEDIVQVRSSTVSKASDLQLVLIQTENLLLTSICSQFRGAVKNNAEEEQWRGIQPKFSLQQAAQHPNIPGEYRNMSSRCPQNSFTGGSGTQQIPRSTS